MQEYVRNAQKTNCGGVELYRRRFYLSKQTLDKLDNEADKLGLTPSEYVAILVNAQTVPKPANK